MTEKTAWYWGLSLTDGAFLSVEEPTDAVYWERIPGGVGPGQTFYLDDGWLEIHLLKYETHLRGAA